MRYDAAIIGAGANGLTAAAVLARAGLKTLVIERAAQPGGRLVTDAFHPGYAASPFMDRIAEIPSEVAAALELTAPLRIENLPQDMHLRRMGALARIFAEARQPYRRDLLSRLRRRIMPPPAGLPWPGQDLATLPLASWPGFLDRALTGRATDPDLAGSALTLLALAGAEPVGGLGALGKVFAAAASRAELRLGVDAREVVVEAGHLGGRACGVVLADGSRVTADAVISTLDFKSSILSLFPWATLPPAMMAAACQWRPGGGTARLLLALRGSSGCHAPLLLPGDGQSRAAFRRGVVPRQPPLLVDPVSRRDPALAPAGGETLTVTISNIPARLFDGTWTPERRLRLASAALRRVDAALPGLLAALTGIRVLAPPDIEARLGASDGDLDGGALAPDQMLGLRPGARTALAGFYLGGASNAAGPLGTGAAGFAAAISLLADR